MRPSASYTLPCGRLEILGYTDSQTTGTDAVTPSPGGTTSVTDSVADRPVVLVVDDDPAVRRVVELMVGLLGHPVAAVADGATAAAAFAADPSAFAAVVLDVRMPGLDGPETLAALRAVDPGVRCVFMTGDPGQNSDADLLALGAVAVLRKPFRSHQLAAVLSDEPAAVAPSGK